MSFRMLFLLSALCLFSCTQSEPAISIEAFRAASYHEYQVYSWNEALTLDWVTARPDRADQTIYFCVPAAFTRAGDYAIDGAYLENGECHHIEEVNPRLGGGLTISQTGEATFVDTHKGSLLNEEFCSAGKAKGDDFFQQILLVHSGVPSTFKDKSLFVRRALVAKEDGSLHFLESNKSCSLSQFTVDLVEFGAFHAIYLDMGSFDEGWYRFAGEALTIGKSKSQTELQTNWLVLKSK